MKFLILSCKVALLLMLFISCKKNAEQAPPELIQQYDLTRDGEQAFPDETGQLFTAKFNNHDIYATKKGNRYVWMGDIAFDEHTFDSLKNFAFAPNARTFKPTTNTMWPGGGVPYVIENGFTQAEIGMINAAIAHWQANTTINFRVRISESNYVRFVPGSAGSGLYSDFIGRKGGSQLINLEPGVFITGSVIHEIGHVLGLYHEQCRADRNNWIAVFYNRVVPNNTNTIYQFRTYVERQEAGAEIGALDFESIMMYGSFAFSDGVNPTMTRLDNTTWNGQRTALSVGDVETTALLYGPPYGRLAFAQVSSWEDGSGSFRDEWEYFVDLLSDEAGTTLFNTPVAKTVHVKVFPRVWSSSERHYVDGAPYTITANVAPGESRVSLGIFTVFETSWQGNVSDGAGYSFQIEDGFGR